METCCMGDVWKKKINYSLETCCGVVLCCIAFGNEVEIKAKEAEISLCSFFNIPLVDYTYAYTIVAKQQVTTVLRALFCNPFCFCCKELPVVVIILYRKNINMAVLLLKAAIIAHLSELRTAQSHAEICVYSAAALTTLFCTIVSLCRVSGKSLFLVHKKSCLYNRLIYYCYE